VAARLAFYPQGWPIGLAGAGAAIGFTAPRAGLLFALAVAFFPLANISLGQRSSTESSRSGGLR
jgi:hypothetical protein